MPSGARLGALLASSLVVQAVVFLARPASTYAAIAVDVPAAALGAIGAAFAVAPLLLAVPLGSVADRIGEGALQLVGGLVLVGACLVLVLAPAGPATLVGGNALLGAGQLACVIGQQTHVAHQFEASRLDAAFGYYTFAASLGQALGPLLIAAVGGTALAPDTDRILVVAALLALPLVLLAPVLGLRRRPRRTDGADGGGGLRGLLRLPGLTRALTTSAVVIAAIDLTLVYLPALGAERGLGAGTVGAMLTVRAVFSMLSRVGLGRLTGRFGRGPVLLTSIVASAGGLALLAVPLPVPVMFVVLAVVGLGLGVGQPLTMSWLTRRAPAEQRAQAVTLRLAGNRVGQVVVPSVLGAAAVGGASVALLAVALLLAAMLPVLRGQDLD
ncbi:MFS transporter [Nocardioides sp. ChNu-153]|uniref:MFS transporter n=1 Tax=unclassified Nocardioides TaxID=2615069 RepID=UPI0024065189|nr:MULTISPECIES: MFS transporter [unclassified Nocardioides]MDF9716165.1 MFS transporter [Nocardioides sp. ChNu-99]MDN7121555.1 MFS transporter [Nocardioides sp. ChNu-153]